MRVDLYVHDPEEPSKLDQILHLLTALTAQEKTMADLLAGLTAEVTRNTSVEASALALIEGFGAQLAAAGTDPTKLAALQAQLAANDDALAAAVAKNTPAAAPPGGSPPPPPSGPPVNTPA